MKIITLALTILFCSNLQAQSDFNGTWDISRFENLEFLSLDFNLGTEFVSISGAIDYSDGSSLPVTGSCFFNQNDGVFCLLQLNRGYSVKFLIASDLRAYWETVNVLGQVVESGEVSFVGG
ncbi:MAG: hypothetical protein R3F41_02155 [Gammaproteobacteria bacterium]|nr:hypothetical protein [Pseudomonadales bacterium]MCP5345903.1 hypothetical protein [Pseudomonadales bacterium]